MGAKTDPLLNAVGELERVLDEDTADRPRDWAQRLEQALASLAEAVRKHAATLESPDGRVVEVDRPPQPSPALDRRAAQLRRELEGFREEAEALRSRVGGAVQGQGLEINPSGLAGALPVAPEAGAVPDFAVFRQRANQLLNALERYEEEEARLILDSVTPDLGAGD